MERYNCTDEETRDFVTQLASPLFQGYLGKFAPFVKDRAFHVEKEWRVVHRLTQPERARLQFLQRSSMMTRHIPLGFIRVGLPKEPAITRFGQPDFGPLPIRKIRVGPGRHQQVSKHSVEVLLDAHGNTSYDREQTGFGWNEVEVSCSRTPLQAV